MQTFGFLRIPAYEDMRLQLKPGADPTQVGEEQTVELDVRDALDVGADDVIEIRQDDSYSVQRANARCAPSGTSSASYSAGREAPWTDLCSVAVRLQGQEAWSIVAMPLTIAPKDPQASLNPLSRTVSPGDTETVDLVPDMITWEGGRVGSVANLNLDELRRFGIRGDRRGRSGERSRQGRCQAWYARTDRRELGGIRRAHIVDFFGGGTRAT